jgi:hypothetical protein
MMKKKTLQTPQAKAKFIYNSLSKDHSSAVSTISTKELPS